jgi:hypothetical protein
LDNLKEGDHFGELGVDAVVLMDLKEIGRERVD